jgi:hypothetical protein
LYYAVINTHTGALRLFCAALTEGHDVARRIHATLGADCRARTGAAPPSHDLDRLKAWSGQLAAASEHADRTCTDAGALGAFAT